MNYINLLFAENKEAVNLLKKVKIGFGFRVDSEWDSRSERTFRNHDRSVPLTADVVCSLQGQTCLPLYCTKRYKNN